MSDLFPTSHVFYKVSRLFASHKPGEDGVIDPQCRSGDKKSHECGDCKSLRCVVADRDCRTPAADDGAEQTDQNIKKHYSFAG